MVRNILLSPPSSPFTQHSLDQCLGPPEEKTWTNMSRGPPGWLGQEEWPREEVHLAQPREGVAVGPKPARGTFKISKQTESHPSPEV